MSFSDKAFWPLSHMIVLALVPVATIIMFLDAKKSIDLEGAGLPILMVVLTVAVHQWDWRRKQLQEQDADNG